MQADRGGSVEVGQTVDDEVAAIQHILDQELANNSSANSSVTHMSMLFVKDEYKTAQRTLSALFVQFATQEMVGASYVLGYGIKIFQTGGWSSDLASLLAGIGIVIQAAFGFSGALLADEIGRRNALHIWRSSRIRPLGFHRNARALCFKKCRVGNGG